MSKLRPAMRACVIFLVWATAAVALPAQTLTTLHTFDNKDGSQSDAGLVQGADGKFYGTTSTGGADRLCLANTGCGTVFNITPSGELTFLSFDFTNGSNPEAALIQAPDGNFFGTASSGGAYGAGTVFKIIPSGTLTTLYSFCSQGGINCLDGAGPFAGLVQATDGNLFGTTAYDGANVYGTVFKITTSGTLTTLHSFDGVDGDNPNALVQGADGDFYGTTFYGGANATCHGETCGTVFKITPGGVLTTLHSFDGTDGEGPAGSLIQGSGGNFYGTTNLGGANINSSCPYGCGTVFRITPSGMLTTLHSFDTTDGSSPGAGLVQATNGDLFGTTADGGANGNGSIFKITLSGALTTLHSFDRTVDGANPEAPLVQGTDGKFYGTTFEGGAFCPSQGGCGTVFSLSVGLAPFVETLPTSRRVGAAVKILGTNLTGATSVTFNGTAATFTVVSDSEITTTVPTGATTGTVQVVTPSGTLSSNVPFRVRP